MVRRRSTVRFRNGAPGHRDFSNFWFQDQVTNQVMRLWLTAGTARRTQTPVPPLACGNQTQCDGVRQNRQPLSGEGPDSAAARLRVGVLGVLVISGEYGTGMIRSSLTAVPRRLPVVWAKLGVFAGVVFAVTLVTSFVSFFLGQALLSSQHLGVAISAPGALRSVAGAALYLTVAGMIGMALGGLLRNTAAGISTFVAVFFVIPPLTGLLPASWSSHFAQYLPSNAGEVLYGEGNRLAHPLAPWAGFGVLCSYAVMLIALAAWRLRRADA